MKKRKILLGLALFSKVIKHLSKKYTAETQFASLAFVISAPVILIKTCIVEAEVTFDPWQFTLLIVTAITAFLLVFSIKTITRNKNRAIISQIDMIEAESYEEFLIIKTKKEKKKEKRVQRNI